MASQNMDAESTLTKVPYAPVGATLLFAKVPFEVFFAAGCFGVFVVKVLAFVTFIV